MEIDKQSLDNYFEELIAIGRRSYGDLTTDEAMKLSGYLLYLSQDSSYEDMLDADAINHLPKAIARYLINETEAAIIGVRASMSALGMRMYRIRIEEMFADYKHPLTKSEEVEQRYWENESRRDL